MRRRAQPSSQSHSGPTSGSSGAGNKRLISVENVLAQGVLFGGDRLVRCPGHEEPPTTCGPNVDTHDEAVLGTGRVRASRREPVVFRRSGFDLFKHSQFIPFK